MRLDRYFLAERKHTQEYHSKPRRCVRAHGLGRGEKTEVILYRLSLVYAPQKSPTMETFFKRTRFIGSCSRVPPANPMTSARPFQAMHLRESSAQIVQVRVHNSSDITLAPNETDRIIYDIGAFTLSDFKNFLLPSRFRIVDGEVSTTHSFRDLEFGFCTCYCDYTCAKS